METPSPTQPPTRSVLLLGATGLVGGECLRLLLADPAIARVTALTRRSLGIEDRKLETSVLDFETLFTEPPPFAADAIICALGTTIKQAGSQERFRRIDLAYPLAVARLGIERGARHLILVSALGADARSRVFYLRVKGELEVALLALSYPAVTIVRPSFLFGDRRETRWGEEIGKRLAFLVPRRYKPVPARAVAEVLVAAAREGGHGRRIIESAELHDGGAGGAG